MPAATAETTLGERGSFAWSVAFSPDQQTLAAGCDTVEVWNLGHRSVSRLKGHKDWVRSVTFSPDGKTLATASHDRTARLWDVNSGSEIATFRGHKPLPGSVLSVAFSPDGQTLATASADKSVGLWDIPRNSGQQ